MILSNRLYHGQAKRDIRQIVWYIMFMESKYLPLDLMNLTKPELVTIILDQQQTIAQLGKTIALLEAMVVQQGERIRQLEEQIHKDSHNSHLPPSQSPHTIKNLRKKTDKPQGGQLGHPGKTLEMVNNPTHTFRYSVTKCEQCGNDLSNTPVEGYERRQVFDIPAIVCEVTEYQVEKKRCACGHLTAAGFPCKVSAPVQYGINIQTMVSLLADHEYLSCERISELMEHLIGYRVNESTVCSFQNKLYTKLADFEAKSKLHLVHSEVIHNDETGLSVNGKSRWVHVTSTKELTHYAVDDKRGQAAINRIGILPHFQGRAIHDDYKSYFGYQCRHGCCNAHHLRELIFFEEEEKAFWARPLADLLREAKAAVEKAQQAGQDHLDSQSLQDLESHYCEILEGALTSVPAPVRTGKRGKPKKTKQLNFIERLLEHKESTLAFMHDFRVPFDNNLAERDLRMVKLKDKVSGTFRSFHGAECFARIRGYISTVRKNGRNVFEEVKKALCGQPFLLQEW